MASRAYVFHCLDTSLVQEYLQTCSEYFGYVKKPFKPIPLKDLWKLEQPDWAEAYKQWGILQFFVGVITALVYGSLAILYATSDMSLSYTGTVSEAVFQTVCRIAIAYCLAHYSWFAVSRKNGCCCWFLFCCECAPLLLLWGIVGMLWGIAGFVGAISVLGVCPLCIIGVLCQAAYCITLFYMGLSSFKLWIQNGSEIVPPAVEVKGPEGEVIGQRAVEVKGTEGEATHQQTV